MKYFTLTILLFAGCNHSSNLQPEDTKVSRSADMQNEIDYILSLDEAYKEEEKMYLEEIRKAEVHNDEIAFKFFFERICQSKKIKTTRMDKKRTKLCRGWSKYKILIL